MKQGKDLREQSSNANDLRMVFFVPYNISEIQKGIQAGHCALEYEDMCFRKLVEASLESMLSAEHCKYQDFVRNHKTWMIYNGGTTNNQNFELGTLDLIPNKLRELGIVFAEFYEPDLNNALTAVCCIVDYNELDLDRELIIVNGKIQMKEVDELSHFIRSQRLA